MIRIQDSEPTLNSGKPRRELRRASLGNVYRMPSRKYWAWWAEVQHHVTICVDNANEDFDEELVELDPLNEGAGLSPRLARACYRATPHLAYCAEPHPQSPLAYPRLVKSFPSGFAGTTGALVAQDNFNPEISSMLQPPAAPSPLGTAIPLTLHLIASAPARAGDAGLRPSKMFMKELFSAVEAHYFASVFSAARLTLLPAFFLKEGPGHLLELRTIGEGRPATLVHPANIPAGQGPKNVNADLSSAESLERADADFYDRKSSQQPQLEMPSEAMQDFPTYTRECNRTHRSGGPGSSVKVIDMFLAMSLNREKAGRAARSPTSDSDAEASDGGELRWRGAEATQERKPPQPWYRSVQFLKDTNAKGDSDTFQERGKQVTSSLKLLFQVPDISDLAVPWALSRRKKTGQVHLRREGWTTRGPWAREIPTQSL
ncbi:hypothetical protein B0H14DRAFT_2594105 [Mycena olivaceomarginata]|nr:hypothetical protein B0H14DRAFT_2594105 [Mycena olivaceomarginata]